MNRRAALLAALAWLAPLAAATPPLVDQLGDRDFRKREAAARQLEAQGAAALPALREAAAHPDPEVRQRAASIAETLERQVLLAPRRLTLKLDQKPIKDVVAALAKQSGYRVDLQGSGATQLVSIAADNEPFWPVLERVCSQAGLGISPHHDPAGGLLLTNQGGYAPFVHFEGPFRLAAQSFQYNKSFHFATLPSAGPASNRRTDGLTLAFTVIAEPRLPLLGIGQPRVQTADTDDGQSLVPAAKGGNQYEARFGGYYGYRNHQMQTQLNLLGHNPPARALKYVRGSLPVTILTEQRPVITIENVPGSKGKKFEGGQVTLEIEDVKDGNKSCQIVATARRNAGKEAAMDYSWTNSLHQRIELFDAKGNKYQSQGFNWSSGSPTTVQGTFMFGDPGTQPGLGKPHKLVYYQWVTAQHQVEFEFRDLPLP